MKEMIKIGNASAFWGDSPSAAAQLVLQQPDLDYLTLDYLAELSMSIMASQREKNPSLGYAKDFIEVVMSLIPFWKTGSKLKVITNAGGLNPVGCAKACQEILKAGGMHHIRIGVVSGDDVLIKIKENPKKSLFSNLESGKSSLDIQQTIVTANAYLGAKSISEALLGGVDIVITGRTADPSLTVGPCVAHFGWSWNDFDKLAGATIAGHLIECGTQVTGGISTNWLAMKHCVHIGFPVVEIFDDGSCIVTKPMGSDGKVSIDTVKEQLLYEIGDPDNYLSPDATVSFLSLSVKQEGTDRVLVTGAKGRKPPETYKVSATYRDGFKTEGTLVVFGQDAVKKANICGEIILKRMKDAGLNVERSQIDCLGAGAVAKGVIPQRESIECVLRIALSDHREEVLQYFSKELASLVTSGPQGITGYTSGRPHIRPVFGFWPCLIERSEVLPKVEFLEPL